MPTPQSIRRIQKYRRGIPREIMPDGTLRDFLPPDYESYLLPGQVNTHDRVQAASVMDDLIRARWELRRLFRQFGINPPRLSGIYLQII